jgi:uncharacterized membrane protein YbhN (UPF0104 family)
MSKTLANILKLTISLGLGIFIIWFTTSKLTSKDIADITNIFKRADYKWLVMGPIIGMLSNVVRAERWKLLLNSVGYQPRRINVISSVFVMYALNLVFPRLGEVTRCTLLYKTDDIPLDKSIDMVSILIVGALLMAFQYQLLFDLLNNTILSHYSGTAKSFTTGYLGIIALVGLIAVVAGIIYFLYRMREHRILGKVWNFGMGILNGLASILKLDNPLLFIFYSFLVWFMYFLMIYVCFFALPETAHLGIWPGLACLFFGGFAYIISPGGLGAYPATLGAVLLIYSIPFTVGFGFGWLVWSAQTAAVIVFGIISFILVSRNFTVSSKSQIS